MQVIWAFYATDIPCFSKSLSLFSCKPLVLADADAGSFLRARPAMLCWEGEHLALAFVGAGFVLFYMTVYTGATASVLFVSRSRADDVRFNRRFGFLYKRFFWHLLLATFGGMPTANAEG